MRSVLLFLPATLCIAAQFTTPLGDTNPYLASALTTDSLGNTYVVGSRQLGSIYISNLNSTTILQPGSDVFLTKLDPTGTVLFTRTFAGKGTDVGTAVTLDPSGNIYIAGFTTSADFPLSNALQSASYQSGGTVGTGFIIKLTNDGKTILYATYLGGALGPSSISALATDAKGNLYVTGMTAASDFPRTLGALNGTVLVSPYQLTGAIVASISAAGDKILYSGTIIGNGPVCSNILFCSETSTTVSGTGIAVDPAGNVYVGGNSNTTYLPTTSGAFVPAGLGPFVAKINAGGTGLGYLTYLSSTQSVVLRGQTFPVLSTTSAITVDASGSVYLTGTTADASFPTTPGSLQPTYSSDDLGSFGFVAKLNPTGNAIVWGTYFGSEGTFVNSLSLDPSGNVWIAGTSPSAPNANGWSNGPEFVAGLNSTGSKLIYSAQYPSGTVAQSVAVDPSGFVHIVGSNAFVSAISPTAPASMKIFAFQNAFGGNATARIARAEVVSIYGPGIGPSVAASVAPVNGIYPTSFNGVQVAINGIASPLLYVSANQINAVVPWELLTNIAATARVTNGTTISPDYPVWLLTAAPVAFPTVLNQDGTVNSLTNPAHSGSIATFYATGWQTSIAPLANGQIATTAQNLCATGCPVVQTNTIYPASATVLYGGPAPGIVAGVSQLNLQIGPVKSGSSPFQFNFYVGGPSNLTQSMYVAP